MPRRHLIEPCHADTLISLDSGEEQEEEQSEQRCHADTTEDDEGLAHLGEGEGEGEVEVEAEAEVKVGVPLTLCSSEA